MLYTAGKVLERIIHQRIKSVVEPLLYDNQYGFRKGRSTLDAIDLVVNSKGCDRRDQVERRYEEILLGGYARHQECL